MPAQDGGYGWIICAIACVIAGSFGTMDFGFAVVLGPLTNYFDAPLEVMALGGDLIVVAQYCFAPLFVISAKKNWTKSHSDMCLPD